MLKQKNPPMRIENCLCSKSGNVFKEKIRCTAKIDTLGYEEEYDMFEVLNDSAMRSKTKAWTASLPACGYSVGNKTREADVLMFFAGGERPVFE
jgi:hypothetical protein